MVGWGGLVFLEYGVVGEVGFNIVRSCGEDVTWCAEWVGVILLCGPANEGVAGLNGSSGGEDLGAFFNLLGSGGVDVDEVDGDELLNKMVLKNVKTGELTTYEADEEDGLFGLFGFIGMIPNSGLFEGVIEMDRGYIKTDDNMHTNIPGVYAAGDIRVKSLRQVVTAAADGAIAAMQAEKYLAEME